MSIMVYNSKKSKELFREYSSIQVIKQVLQKIPDNEYKVRNDLLEELNSAEVSFSVHFNELYKSMEDNSEWNVARLGKDIWYVIIYYEKQEPKHCILPILRESGLALVTCSNWYTSKMPQWGQVEAALNTIKDDTSARGFQWSIEEDVKRKYDSLYESFKKENKNISKEEERDDPVMEEELIGGIQDGVKDVEECEIKISTHAYMRWAERIVGVSERSSKVFVKSHKEELESAIMQGLSKAKVVWVGEDRVEYLLDDQDIIYLRIKESNVSFSTIITLYRVKFGFAPEINHVILTKQLDVIKDKFSEYKENLDSLSSVGESCDTTQREIDNEIESLQAKIEYLEVEKESVKSKYALATSKVGALHKIYEIEFNKVFKKWKGNK